MTPLTAMYHNHTMMRLVLPTSIDKNKTKIKSKLNEINEERVKECINALVLE